MAPSQCNQTSERRWLKTRQERPCAQTSLPHQTVSRSIQTLCTAYPLLNKYTDTHTSVCLCVCVLDTADLDFVWDVDSRGQIGTIGGPDLSFTGRGIFDGGHVPRPIKCREWVCGVDLAYDSCRWVLALVTLFTPASAQRTCVRLCEGCMATGFCQITMFYVIAVTAWLRDRLAKITDCVYENVMREMLRHQKLHDQEICNNTWTNTTRISMCSARCTDRQRFKRRLHRSQMCRRQTSMQLFPLVCSVTSLLCNKCTVQMYAELW